MSDRVNNPANDPVNDLLVSLRDKVMGVSESTLATVDGLVVATDAAKTHPESMAALAAATLSLGHRLADQGAAGTLRQVTAQCSTGHVIVTAVGTRALLAVVADEGLDTAAFQREIPSVVASLNTILTADTSA
jgi:predicted regulator of Ras-like GTPase activity (Roadblock/LC7/MglB family)